VTDMLQEFYSNVETNGFSLIYAWFKKDFRLRHICICRLLVLRHWGRIDIGQRCRQ